MQTALAGNLLLTVLGWGVQWRLARPRPPNEAGSSRPGRWRTAARQAIGEARLVAERRDIATAGHSLAELPPVPSAQCTPPPAAALATQGSSPGLGQHARPSLSPAWPPSSSDIGCESVEDGRSDMNSYVGHQPVPQEEKLQVPPALIRSPNLDSYFLPWSGEEARPGNAGSVEGARGSCRRAAAVAACSLPRQFAVDSPCGHISDGLKEGLLEQGRNTESQASSSPRQPSECNSACSSSAFSATLAQQADAELEATRLQREQLLAIQQRMLGEKERAARLCQDLREDTAPPQRASSPEIQGRDPRCKADASAVLNGSSAEIPSQSELQFGLDAGTAMC